MAVNDIGKTPDGAFAADKVVAEIKAGRVARICMITARRFYSEQLTSEQVAENLEKIMDPTRYIVPAKSMDQYQLVKLNE